MAEAEFSYIIAGGGLAGANAIEGIRLHDAKGPILLVGAELDIPYDRPPLSKQLWSGGKQVEEIFTHPKEFYARSGVELRLGSSITELDAAGHTVRDQAGNRLRYKKLLLATGATPRKLGIPGGDLPGLIYYRTLEDYRKSRAVAGAGKSAVVIGGGFIGSEMAAALNTNGVAVTMVFPGRRLVPHVFPEGLAGALTEHYRSKGVQILTEDVPTSIERRGEGFLVNTRAGRAVPADLVVVGIGVTPNISLAQAAGLKTGNGVVVDEFLQTSNPDIYAAGDIALFPEQVLGQRRIEHWDNAVTQGKHAGGNMAGAHQPFTNLPFFYSDLFEFGYEAVGDVDSRHEIFADWQEPNKTGVIYYLADQRVRGAMMCNVWGKVDAAREMIRGQKIVKPEDLRGAIR